MTARAEKVKNGSATKVNGNGEILQNEIIRDEVFSKFDTPLGFSQQHYLNQIVLLSAHVGAVVYFYYAWLGVVPRSPFLFETLYGFMGGLGITVGAHRLWTHQSFKAKLPLQIILMIWQTIAFQYPIAKWSLDHRVHHKATDTNGDPHSAARGFWFSHIGWLLLPKHADHIKRLKTTDCSDLEKDPVVRFQSKHYWLLTAIFVFIVPMFITWYIWRLPLIFCLASSLRRVAISFHFSASVNSFAHLWGFKPYDKNISSVDNPIVALLTTGEGWHNFHHVFPWDYKAAEFGWRINLSTIVIDTFAKIGWAYDLKTVSKKLLNDRRKRTGDGGQNNHNQESVKEIDNGKAITNGVNGNGNCHKNDDVHDDEAVVNNNSMDISDMKEWTENLCWGWGDETIPEDMRKITTILKPEREALTR